MKYAIWYGHASHVKFFKIQQIYLDIIQMNQIFIDVNIKVVGKHYKHQPFKML